MRLVKRHFPKENRLHKIFNKNTLKISYSCMGNVASVLSAHNRNILYPKKSEFGCNCRSKTDFPLDNKCLTPKIVYQADVWKDTNDEKKFYFGVSETPFNERFTNHKEKFANKKYRNSTELSKYIWQLTFIVIFRGRISFTLCSRWCHMWHSKRNDAQPLELSMYTYNITKNIST